jgi:hypothetical protein
LKKAQPIALLPDVFGKSETLITTCATEDKAVELYNSTVRVPVGDASLLAILTATPEIVMLDPVWNDCDALVAKLVLMLAGEVVASKKDAVEPAPLLLTTPQVAADVKLPDPIE